jgi:Ca2+-binding RTX toxin-like protein
MSDTKLPVDTGVTALDLAETMFGDGVKVISATYVGDDKSAGIYSDGETVSPGVVPADGGIILSTGEATDFTQSGKDPNKNGNTSTDTKGFDNDATLNELAGVKTFDGASLTATFVPTGDTLTMQMIFGSEEYPEWVNAGYNDVVAIYVNGEKVELSIGDGDVSIDNINAVSNSNLYHDNSKDSYNTEMDGVTGVLTMKAPVKAGEANTIIIMIADGGDAVYDSNLLIVADSVQTSLIAHDDTAFVTRKGISRIDLMSNDVTTGRNGVHITSINDVPVAVGDKVQLKTGEVLTLNADGTVTLLSTAASDKVTFTYTIADDKGTTDTAFVTIAARAVEGTSGNDSMAVGYKDANGHIIDGADGDAEVILGHAGNDKITAGLGDDDVYGGDGNDFMRTGAGNDIVDGGAGNDVLDGQAGDDRMSGGTGDDVYWLDSAGDSISEAGGGGYDKVMSNLDHVLAAQFEELWLNEGTAARVGTGNALDNKIVGNANDNAITGLDGKDKLMGQGGNDSVDGGAGNDDIWGGAGHDRLLGGNDTDKLYGEAGNDLLFGGAGKDQLNGGDGADRVDGGAGVDIVGGGLGADVFVLATGTGRDTVTDFQNGVDHIGVAQADVNDVTFRAVSGGVEVSIGGGDTLFVKGVTLAQMNDADIFAL